MSMWLYKDVAIDNIDQIPEGTFGYVYLITNIITGKIYVGKKQLSSNRKTKLTKKEKLLPENKRKKYKRVVKESDWKGYWGSSDELKKDIVQLGIENFKREILCFCSSKIDLSYYEVHYQISYNVLFSDSYNGTILGKFYKGKINEIN